jgi:hypothetical protein
MEVCETAIYLQSDRRQVLFYRWEPRGIPSLPLLPLGTVTVPSGSNRSQNSNLNLN